MLHLWYDGKCKNCGFPVVERPDSTGEKDYENACLNDKCENSIWHSVFDDESLDYYEHRSNPC